MARSLELADIAEKQNTVQQLDAVPEALRGFGPANEEDMLPDVAVLRAMVAEALQCFLVGDLARNELCAEARREGEEPRQSGRRRWCSDHVAQEDLQRCAGTTGVERLTRCERREGIAERQFGQVDGGLEHGEGATMTADTPPSEANHPPLASPT
jgi:hypothetical protein